jgi:acetylornithine deacetylase
MIDRLTRYVGVRSLSREERELADIVCADLELAGLHVEREVNNVWCVLGDRPTPRLLLNSHLDTVPATAGWDGDAWTLRRDGDRLIGLGANDAKGCVVAMIEAVLAIKRALDAGAPLGGTVVLATTAEEEISGHGLGTILEQLGPLDAALVGEPTDLVPMIAQRGLLILRGQARGRAAHPANTPTDETNAIATAARDIARLRDFDWGAPHALLGRCHAHVTRIEGGVANNVVPDTCEFTIDVRTTPAETHAALTARLAAAMESDVRVHSDRLVPVETDSNAPIVSAVLSALPGSRATGSRAMSDMVYLGGIPAVKIGPGESARSHTANEYIRVSELADGASAYDRTIRAYFAATAGRESEVGASKVAR